LLDLLMPGINGYQVLESIKSEKKLRQIPVVVLTGVADVASAARCLQAGADDYIVKPYDITILKAKVALFLDKKRMQDEQRHLTMQLEEANAMLRKKVAEVDSEIRERKELEEALRQSQTRLQALSDAAFEGIAIHQNGKIVDANRQFSKLFGVHHRLIQGMPLIELIGQHDRSAVEKALREDRDYWYLEITRNGLHGSAMTMELRGRNIPSRGAMARVIAARDITARKETERRLAAAVAEAQKASELKDTFISLLSHNLREPLGSVVSMLNAVGNMSMETSVRDRLLERCLGAANSLLNMIDRLLDLGRLKNGKINPRSAIVNCWTMAEEMIDRMGEISIAKQIKVINDIPLGWNMNSDQGLLAEVLHNILSNAIKYSNPGSQVKVGMGFRGAPAIVVEDSGMGIGPELAGNLFTADPRNRRKGTSGEKGLGIGLSLAMEIMKALGGEIVFESKNGGGSKFYMRLPLGGAKILLAGRNQGSIAEMRELLEGCCLEVSTTMNAGEAGELVKAIRPLLVVTDLDEMAMAGAIAPPGVEGGQDGENAPVILFLSNEDAPMPEAAGDGVMKISKARAGAKIRETLERILKGA